MREIRTYGSEGGAAVQAVPTPIYQESLRDSRSVHPVSAHVPTKGGGLNLLLTYKGWGEGGPATEPIFNAQHHINPKPSSKHPRPACRYRLIIMRLPHQPARKLALRPVAPPSNPGVASAFLMRMSEAKPRTAC